MSRKGKFSNRAKRHAAVSRSRTRKMLGNAAQRSGPVKVYYMPGFEPPNTAPETVLVSKTKFPFEATINGKRVLVHEGKIEELQYLGEVDPEDEKWWEWSLDD